MRDNADFQINSKQLVFIIIGTVVATGILSLPRAASSSAHQDAWIAVMGGALISMTMLFLMERLLRRFPGYTFVEVSRLLFGKVIGTALVIGFMLYTLLGQVIILYIFTEITSMFVLPNTPRQLIYITSILTAIYIASKGARVVAWINEIFFYQFLLVAVLWTLALSSGDYTNLVPVGGSGLKGISQGVLQTSFAYSGIEVLLLTYSMVTRPQKVMKAGLTAVGLATGLYLLVTIVCLLVFGAILMEDQIFWPGLTLLKVVEIPVFERLEFFVLVIWMGVGIRPIFTWIMAGAYSITGLLGMEVQQMYHYAVWAWGAVLLGAVFIPVNIKQMYQLADYYGYIFFVVVFGYSLLFLSADLIRGIKKLLKSLKGR